MNRIEKLSDLNTAQKDEAAMIIVEGLYVTLRGFSKDKEVLFQLFRQAIDTKMCYAYLKEERVLGVLGLADHKNRLAHKGTEEHFIKILGTKGKFAYKAFRKHLGTVKLANDQEIEIDVLATSSAARGQGVGTALINHVFSVYQGKQVFIETWMKNTGAIKLYERQGFKIFNTYSNGVLWSLSFGKMVRMRRNNG